MWCWLRMVILTLLCWPQIVANYPRGNNLGDNEDMSISIENSSRAFFSNMSNMISDMALLEKQFFIIDSVPNFPFNPARCNMNQNC